ncbi:hypothetical protein C7M84_003898 [Penaeus vannamei]|uniref:Uncharacterized protein n=1 Tax=Penaeus vannamei TaxID=6689 RepID=A0A3R7QFS6_PENVA|nr:hypothetical protein C7M84_003898 [Penaeus vannamei]
MSIRTFFLVRILPQNNFISLTPSIPSLLTAERHILTTPSVLLRLPISPRSPTVSPLDTFPHPTQFFFPDFSLAYLHSPRLSTLSTTSTLPHLPPSPPTLHILPPTPHPCTTPSTPFHLPPSLPFHPLHTLPPSSTHALHTLPSSPTHHTLPPSPHLHTTPFHPLHTPPSSPHPSTISSFYPSTSPLGPHLPCQLFSKLAVRLRILVYVLVFTHANSRVRAVHIPLCSSFLGFVHFFRVITFAYFLSFPCHLHVSQIITPFSNSLFLLLIFHSCYAFLSFLYIFHIFSTSLFLLLIFLPLLLLPTLTFLPFHLHFTFFPLPSSFLLLSPVSLLPSPTTSTSRSPPFPLLPLHFPFSPLPYPSSPPPALFPSLPFYTYTVFSPFPFLPPPSPGLFPSLSFNLHLPYSFRPPTFFFLYWSHYPLPGRNNCYDKSIQLPGLNLAFVGTRLKLACFFIP